MKSFELKEMFRFLLEYLVLIAFLDFNRMKTQLMNKHFLA